MKALVVIFPWINRSFHGRYWVTYRTIFSSIPKILKFMYWLEVLVITLIFLKTIIVRFIWSLHNVLRDRFQIETIWADVQLVSFNDSKLKKVKKPIPNFGLRRSENRSSSDRVNETKSRINNTSSCPW